MSDQQQQSRALEHAQHQHHSQRQSNFLEKANIPASMEEDTHQAPTAQDEAADAALQAFQAQQDAQEAVKRAYAKQLVAQDKAQQVTRQLAAQNETANQVAIMAAKQAAERAANGQKRVSEQQFNQQIIAQEAARSEVAAAQRQPVIAHEMSTGFPDSSLAGGIPQQGFGHAPLNIKQEVDVTAQGLVLQAANSAAAEAQAQMGRAAQLAALDPNAAAQQEASQQAAMAQQKMEIAEKLAESAQSPESALQAAEYVSSNQPNQSMHLG